ncbi:Trimethyllysine dioxygenase [Cladophialophora carrionii]|uniref:Trimethyllysine dioxygenase n=1 Tax=Cladophialophora carrionii TaxID=86049 RepID=A0A1C1CET2_9EURO|nr:Trimethyllysine dioxygenase [Cladophialophora carrionii]
MASRGLAITSTRCYSSTSTEASPSNAAALPRVLVNDMTNQELIIDFNAGTALRYPSFWLRDHCPCSECQHPSTHQRQLDTFSIDPDIKVSSIQSTPAGLEVVWPVSSVAKTTDMQTDTQPQTRTHRSIYPWEWLETHPPFIQASGKTTPSNAPRRTWTHVPPPSSSSNSSLPSVPYDSIISTTSPSGLKTFLQTIHTLGFCLVPRTPPDPSSTQSLVERISHIRPTHYGGFWDFTSAPNPIDTAYTDDYLPPHTDTTYFTDPAGLQLFHCLQPATQGGGESTFVDGFAAAQHLYATSPQHYHALSTYPIVSAALGSPAGAFYNTAVARRGYPVLVHSAPLPGVTTPSPATLVQIRWNNLDRMAPATPSFPNHTALKAWYSAAREWSRVLERPEFLITLQLKPGEPVIFDNWRVLHGRLAFQGQRRVCGAYVAMDDFRARCRGLGIEV